VPARATSDLRKTQDDRSLSLRERDRVRGNETQPTKTAGRILQAQLDPLTESKLAITLSQKPVDSGSARIGWGSNEPTIDVRYSFSRVSGDVVDCYPSLMVMPPNWFDRVQAVSSSSSLGHHRLRCQPLKLLSQLRRIKMKKATVPAGNEATRLARGAKSNNRRSS